MLKLLLFFCVVLCVFGYGGTKSTLGLKVDEFVQRNESDEDVAEVLLEALDEFKLIYNLKNVIQTKALHIESANVHGFKTIFRPYSGKRYNLHVVYGICSLEGIQSCTEKDIDRVELAFITADIEHPHAFMRDFKFDGKDLESKSTGVAGGVESSTNFYKRSSSDGIKNEDGDLATASSAVSEDSGIEGLNDGHKIAPRMTEFFDY
ncbi:unnamed protein product [Bursaphelenchus okinawaensis]|uniref:Cystatin domain-containing protein n=1 Tax=Bursaphelenchus okinawaensis TaxID=465554 RepID=A0A811L9V6_9BILA|nr:unnamed protein product [Bursaphelenchus okinawaensis]CAG9119843.1 unnamed protein product [Bursaphelenchus okinawaensis]